MTPTAGRIWTSTLLTIVAAACGLHFLVGAPLTAELAPHAGFSPASGRAPDLLLVTEAHEAGAMPRQAEDGSPLSILPDPGLPARIPNHARFAVACSDAPEPGDPATPSPRGYIPPPLDLSHLARGPGGLRSAGALPSFFDWRDLGMVTPVKQQDGCGTCWDFGTTSVLESAVLIGEGIGNDFSEQTAALCVHPCWVYYYDGKDDPCLAGGWSWLATESFIRKGAVLESCAPYDPSALRCDGDCPGCGTCPAVKRVNGYRFVTGDQGATDLVKQAVYQHGPTTMAFFWSGDHVYSSGETYDTVYDYAACPAEVGYANHLVSIIGWDDEVPHVETPGAGAWLVKNSWGSDWGNSGTFWLAYDSSCMTEIAYLTYEDYDPAADLLYWDEAGFVGSFGYGDTSAWMTNVFTSQRDCSLTHVEFWATDHNTDYTFTVYQDGDPTDGLEKPVTSQTGTCDEAGYYSIELDGQVELKAGQPFAVAAEMTTDVYTAPIAIEEAAVIPNPPTSAEAAAFPSDFDVLPPIQHGISFARHTDSDPWTDLADDGKNACLRARTAPRRAEISKSVTPSGQLAHGDLLTYTLAISAPLGTEMELYDPLLATTFDRFLVQPEGVEHAHGAITGTLVVTPTDQITVSFVVEVDATHVLMGSATNKACVRPVGGTLAGCVWSNDVANGLSQASSSWSCLPRYGDPEFILTVNQTGPVEFEPNLTAGDFNGDGQEDLVITRLSFQTVETYDLDILINDGNGSLILASSGVFSGSVPAVQNPKEVLKADFNGDGFTDIFVADHGYDAPPFPGYPNTLVLSVPGGRLVDASGNLPEQSDFTHSAAVGDIDRDGDSDLYLGQLWGQSEIDPQLLINDGSGAFTLAEGKLHESLSLNQNGYTAAEFVDVDNDGYPDLVLADAGDDIDSEYSTPHSAVLLNDGLGSFTSPPVALPTKPFAETAIGLDIQPLDLDRDGYQDLLIAYTKGDPSYVGRAIQVLLNNHDGTFRDETHSRLPQSDNNDPYVYQLQLMDIDRDEDLDLLARPLDDQAPDPLLFLNDGAGYFTPWPSEFGLPYLYYDFLDLDGDSGRDLVYATFAPPEEFYALRDLGCPIFLPTLVRNL